MLYTIYMITRHARGKIQWVDLETPSRQELAEIMREFHIDARIEEEIVGTTPYPVILTSPDYLYLILHFPAADPNGGARIHEIDFIVGRHFLITARYNPIESIHSLHKVFEAEELLGLPAHHQPSIDKLLERVLRKLYGALREEVETIGHRIDRIEKDIFGGKERETVRVISEVNRVLLRFDTTIGRHAESLSSLLSELALPSFFGKQFMAHAARIDAEREHVATLIASYRDVATDLRETNDSLLSASQNEVMKTLTVITFIILPLSLISSIFQMNLPGRPLADTPQGFWIIVGVSAVLAVFLVLFSKYKRWF
jgi:magnesium transporter